MAQKRNSRAISSITLAALLSGVKPSHPIPSSQRISLKECIGTKCYAFLNYDITTNPPPPFYKLRAFIPSLEKEGILFGVLLRFDFDWDAEPYSEYAERVLRGPAYEISEPWVRNLALLVRDELLPLLRILDRPFLCQSRTHSKEKPASGVRAILRTRVINEVRARGRLELGGYKGFFSNSEALKEWVFSSQWENWNRAGFSLKQREVLAMVRSGAFFRENPIGDINTKPVILTLDFPLDLKKSGLKIDNTLVKAYSRICLARAIKINSTEEWPLWKDSDTRHFRAIPSLDELVPKEAFGRGRPRGIDFSKSAEKYACVFPAAKVEDKSVLIEQYWWWREIYPEIESEKRGDMYQIRMSKWPELLIKTFKDNWERSAFIYEMRARMSDRNHWDIFGKPWIKLNYSERGIISILWPPEHFGAYLFRSWPYPDPKSEENKEIELREIVSLLAPNGVISDMLLRIVNEESQARGIPRPRKGGGSRVAFPWRALECMDLAHYSMHMGLGGGYSSKKNAEKIYHDACKDIGIEP